MIIDGSNFPVRRSTTITCLRTLFVTKISKSPESTAILQEQKDRLGEMYSGLIEYIKGRSAYFADLWFEGTRAGKSSFVVQFYLIALYLFVMYLWGAFFNWGNVDLDFHDWATINMPRFEVVRDAFVHRIFPLHAECGGCLHGITDRFFVLPDVVTSPQMLLLLFMKPSMFVLMDVLINYSLATAGLLLLRKRFQLSPVSFTFLFLAFQFNGYVQAHYAVGHATWAGYFLFPLFFELIFRLLEGETGWKWVAKLTALSLYAILAGSQHHFTWMMLFATLLAFSYKRGFKWILLAILFSGFASAIRLLPPVLEVGQFSWKFFAVPGYLTLFDFLTSLISLHGPAHVFEAWPYDIGYWEFDYYLGLAGAALLIYFGVVTWVKEWNKGKINPALILPTLALFLFSQSYIYVNILAKVPLLASERIASRMISLPVTLILIVAAIHLDESLKARNITLRFVVFAAIAFLANDLLVHSSLWKIQKISSNFTPEVLNFAGNSVINHQDPTYLLIFYAGSTLSLMTILILSMMVVAEAKRLGT